MGFTEKQMRNGADEGVATGSTPPSADISAEVAGRMGGAEAAAAAMQAQALDLIKGGGTGNGIAEGSMFEWDDGLAIANQPGEAG